MKLFRKLNDFFLTDLDVDVGPAKVPILSHKAAGCLVRESRADAFRCVLVGSLRPRAAALTLKDAHGLTTRVRRGPLGKIEMTVEAPNGRQAYRTIFFLAIGERYAFTNPYGPPMAFRRFRHRDLHRHGT